MIIFYKKRKNKYGFITFLKAKIIIFVYSLANLFLFFIAWLFWHQKLPQDPKKICIFRIGNIGDIVCAIPAMIAIKKAYPMAEITLLTSPGKKNLPGAKDLLINPWFLNRIWTYFSKDFQGQRKKEFIKEIRNENFDLWIELPNTMGGLKTRIRNMAFAKLAGSKRACGFILSTIKLWAKEQSQVYEFTREAEKHLAILKVCGVPFADKISYDLPLPAAAQQAGARIIDKYKIKQNQFFGFVPGAKREANHWPLDYFIKLGRMIVETYSESKIVVFGGKGDFENGEYIKKGIGKDYVINLCGETSILESVFLLRKMRLVVSNDTGPMHLACLDGVKTIGIFSSAELYGTWFPFNPKYQNDVKALRTEIDCQGCYYEKCSRNYECIKSIKPSEVFKEVESLLINNQ